ncbi:DNA cytosine methyltransferase [Nonomuraea sp. NPDC049480]|uniref:DNA cytosine methyltransferase n=1 Tax=Nonomuraea sp. NPDC049480 TaxID=3364353 RepID=UPI0037A95988
MTEKGRTLRSLEICAGGGGQALGLEQAGFEHVMLIENDSDACSTLRANRPGWKVLEADLESFDASDYPDLHGIDLLSGGVPCSPYTIAGHQLGKDDERDLLPVALKLVDQIRPKAVLIENVSTLARGRRYAETKKEAEGILQDLRYYPLWTVLDAQDYGLAQRRRRTVLVALRSETFLHFQWPTPLGKPPSVGQVLLPSMASKGWPGAAEWAAAANDVAPTIVGGSKKHGGGDLGPDRAKTAWMKLGVNGQSIADDGEGVPGPDYVLRRGLPPDGRDGLPRLEVWQVALLQGFPSDWMFVGKKTSRYRQVGNAFPPPVAAAVGRQIAAALRETL